MIHVTASKNLFYLKEVCVQMIRHVACNRSMSCNIFLGVYTVTRCYIIRALDKSEYLMIIWDNFSYFSMKPYVVTPHLNHLSDTIKMRGHNIFLN